MYGTVLFVTRRARESWRKLSRARAKWRRRRAAVFAGFPNSVLMLVRFLV